MARVRFFAYSKFINFTVESPVTLLFESEHLFFFLVASSMPGRYYMMSDKLYDEEEVDLLKEYKK